VSTETAPGQFDVDAPWQLAPQVQARPERFGALLYHFGTRQLSFVQSPVLFRVVRSLAGHPTAGAACAAAGVPPGEMPGYTRALAALAASRMICPREVAS
jgi:putative mycofactocin binding protein MftB